MKSTGFTTRSLNVSYSKKDPHNSLQMPLYESVAFEFDTAEQIEANFRGEYAAHVYSRASSPTVEYFELKIKELVNAHGVLAVSSGMAAIANTIIAIAKAGENIVSGYQLFGHTYALFTQTFSELGLEFRFSALKQKEEIEKLIDSKTRAIYFETVTNPQLEIADIDMLATIAHRHNLLLIADSTLTPPHVFHARNFNVDVEVISATKYLSGGATCFGGVIVDYGNYNWSNNPNFKDFSEKYDKNAFIAKLRKNSYRNTGGSMAPQTANYMIHGIDLMELRVEKCYKNCIALGSFLQKQPEVKKVKYPGLESDSGFALAAKYFNGIPGTIITFDLKSKEACFEFMNRLKIIRRATNLNDNKSLIIHPHSTIYAEFSEEDRRKSNIRDTMLRLSAGIENTDDLIQDIEQALV